MVDGCSPRNVADSADATSNPAMVRFGGERVRGMGSERQDHGSPWFGGEMSDFNLTGVADTKLPRSGRLVDFAPRRARMPTSGVEAAGAGVTSDLERGSLSEPYNIIEAKLTTLGRWEVGVPDVVERHE